MHGAEDMIADYESWEWVWVLGEQAIDWIISQEWLRQALCPLESVSPRKRRDGGP